MAISHDLRDQIDKIDQQMIDLIAERIELCQDASDEEDDIFGPEYQADVIAEWEEIADEKGWNITAMGKICRGLLELCKNQAE
jgi:chorismate mutase